MYGVVLMVAMTGGAETPALFKRGGDCCGTTSYACSGYSCSGYSCGGYSCSGYSCGGYSCSGSSCYGSCTGGRMHKWHKSKGCCGSSCYGSSCYGSAYYGSACYGSACYGSASYGAPVIGCYGAPATYGTPGVIVPDQKMMPEMKGKDVEKLKKPPVSGGTVAAPARITITVPADARVSIDGAATASTETTRTFESPVLPAGKSYSYTFKAEFVRDGKNVVVTKDVRVKAGSEVNVSLESETVVASR